MKKILFVLVCAFAVLSASAQDKKLTLNVGFLFPNTLNAMIGYEYPLSYGNAVEISLSLIYILRCRRSTLFSFLRSPYLLKKNIHINALRPSSSYT